MAKSQMYLCPLKIAATENKLYNIQPKNWSSTRMCVFSICFFYLLLYSSSPVQVQDFLSPHHHLHLNPIFSGCTRIRSWSKAKFVADAVNWLCQMWTTETHYSIDMNDHFMLTPCDAVLLLRPSCTSAFITPLLSQQPPKTTWFYPPVASKKWS